MKISLRPFLLPLLLAVSLCGCAISPYSPEYKPKSDALLAKQIADARQQITDDHTPRLLFAGIAMDDRSEAFEQDVLLAEKLARAIDSRAVVFKLANPANGHATTLPFATLENTRQVIQTLGALARPQDKVMLLLTSHGGPGRLALHAGGKALGAVSGADLVRWTTPLKDRQTLVVVSACFSGSLIPELAREQHIILTAAAKDRTSFGCSSRSDNTFFIKELFGQPTLPTDNLQALMATAVRGVEQRERAMRLAPPSDPQASYGARAQDWARQPINEWLTAR